MRGARSEPGAPPGLPGHRRRAGPDPHRGRRRVLPRRARPRPSRCPRAGRPHRQALTPTHHRGGRVRPDVLPGQERLHPVGARRPRGRRPSRRPTTTPSTTRWRSSRSTPCSPATAPDGVRQVDVPGLVATAFTHRDSRAGDPDLHTHVAVANKVQTLRREVAGHRRPGAVQGHRRRLGDLQHRPREAPARAARASRSPSARTPSAASGRCARSSVSTPA